jgi:hypothetical protein
MFEGMVDRALSRTLPNAPGKAEEPQSTTVAQGAAATGSLDLAGVRTGSKT